MTIVDWPLAKVAQTYGDDVILRGLKWDLPSGPKGWALAQKILHHNITAQEIIRELEPLGVWWGLWGQYGWLGDYEDHAWGEDTIPNMIADAEEEAADRGEPVVERWFGAHVPVVLVAKRPTVMVDGKPEPWDPEEHNESNGLMGNSYVPDHQPLEVVEVRYSVDGETWTSLKVPQGIRTTAALSALESDHGQQAGPAESPGLPPHPGRARRLRRADGGADGGGPVPRRRHHDSPAPRARLGSLTPEIRLTGPAHRRWAHYSKQTQQQVTAAMRDLEAGRLTPDPKRGKLKGFYTIPVGGSVTTSPDRVVLMKSPHGNWFVVTVVFDHDYRTAEEEVAGWMAYLRRQKQGSRLGDVAQAAQDAIDIALEKWRPTKGMFALGQDHLDPRVFNPVSQQMRPDVRAYVLGSLDSYWTPLFGHWQDWAKIYLAGSGASYWWDSDGDLDMMVGVDLDALRAARPANVDVSDDEIIAHLNKTLMELRPSMAHYEPDPGAKPMEVTYFVNPGAYDVNAIHPYAAYDVNADHWVVKPPVLPANWGPDSIPDQTWRKCEQMAREARAVLAMPEPDRTIAGTNMFDWVHEGRKASYSAYGGGWLDEGNVIYQFLSQTPDGLLRRLYLCKHPEAATVAEGVAKTAAMLFRGEVVDYKPERPLTGKDAKPITSLMPGTSMTPYEQVPFADALDAAMGTDRNSDSLESYLAERKRWWRSQPATEISLHTPFVVTQANVNLNRVHEIMDHPERAGSAPIWMVRSGGRIYVMNGHHRLVADFLSGKPTIAASIVNADGLKKAASEDWQTSHRPGGPDYGAQLFDLTGGGQMYPADVYTKPSLYANGEPGFNEAWATISKAKGNPGAMVTMYRALPAQYAKEPVKTGDWVGISLDYCKGHAMQEDPADDWPVMKYTVRADQLWTSADSLQEWGYYGPPVHGSVAAQGGKNQKISAVASGHLPGGIPAKVAAATLYHGTDTTFEPGATLGGTDRSNYTPETYKGSGVYLTSDPAMAFFYAVFGAFSAGRFDGKPHVYEVSAPEAKANQPGEWLAPSATVLHDVTAVAAKEFASEWDYWKQMIIDTPSPGFPTTTMILHEFESRMKAAQ